MFALAYTVLQALQDLNLDSQILNQYFDKHESRTLKVMYTFFSYRHTERIRKWSESA